MALIQAQASGSVAPSSPALPVTGWKEWVKTTATASPTEAALPTNSGKQYETYTVVNEGAATAFVKTGATGVTAQDETAATGTGLVILAGTMVDIRISDGDTHLIASAVTDTVLFVIGRG